jgi:hypothetical protein
MVLGRCSSNYARYILVPSNPRSLHQQRWQITPLSPSYGTHTTNRIRVASLHSSPFLHVAETAHSIGSLEGAFLWFSNLWLMQLFRNYDWHLGRYIILFPALGCAVFKDLFRIFVNAGVFMLGAVDLSKADRRERDQDCLH